MNKDDIIRMAREAGFDDLDMWSVSDAIERFATLVSAAERNSWPAEMEAMERQVNILTDALAQAKAEEREACAMQAWALVLGLTDQDTADIVLRAIRARGN